MLCSSYIYIPLSLCHVDGSMMTTAKSKLLHHLDSEVITIDPATVDVTIVDAMFFLHLHINLPGTMEGVARYILMQFNCKAAQYFL